MKKVFIVLLICSSTMVFGQGAIQSSGNVVESVADFVGGQDELFKFLAKTIRYPKQAKKSKIEGKVEVRFIVEADGTVSNPEVIKGVNKELDEEAIRVIKKMPKWKPGRQQGKGVRTQQVLPINFKL